MISAAATATAAASASATFNGARQDVTLSATITSAAGTVNEGTETFTILNGTTTIGTPVTVNVSRRRRQRRLCPARRHSGRHIHHPGGLQRHDQLPRLHRQQPSARSISAAATATAAASASATFNVGART